MSLIKRSDCGRDVSHRADSCPHYGCPGRFFTKPTDTASKANETYAFEESFCQSSKIPSSTVINVDFAKLDQAIVEGVAYNKSPIRISGCLVRIDNVIRSYYSERQTLVRNRQEQVGFGVVFVANCI